MYVHGIKKVIHLNMQRKFDEAIKCYDISIQLCPNAAITWSNKGILMTKQGKYDEAIKCFDQSIQLNPNCVVALNNKALVLDLTENFENAEYFYDLASKTDAIVTKEWSQQILNSDISKGKLFTAKYK